MSPHLLVLGGPLRERAIPLPRVPTTLGADPFAHVSWLDPDLEAHHAIIRWRAGQHVLVDQGTPSGTSVNGWRIVGPYALEHGDDIRIGRALFRYQSDLPPATVSKPPSPPLRGDTAAAPRKRASPSLPPQHLLIAVLGLTLLALVFVSTVALPGLWRALLPESSTLQTPTSIPTRTHTVLSGAATPTRPLPSTPVPSAEPEARVPVQLGSPADGSAGPRQLLQWNWPAPLAADEWFSVWVWRTGESPSSLTWTKERSIEIGANMGAGRYAWQVIVVRGTVQGIWQGDLSAPSEIRSFLLVAYTPTASATSTTTSTATPTHTLTPTATHTPEPISRIIVSGVVSSLALGGSPVENATIRIYVGEHRAVATSNPLGQYVAEVLLKGRGERTQISVLASREGYEPGVANAELGGYGPGTTEHVAVDVGMHLAATPTPRWIPPTATP